MKVTDKVRQRRLERIKSLKETAHGPEDARERAVYGRGPAPLHPGRPADSPADSGLARKWEDPEFVWKQKYRQDAAYYGRASFGGDEPGGWFTPPAQAQLWIRLLICAVLFAAIWGMFRLPYPWANTGKQLVTAALTESMNFDAVAAWYQAKFNGAPSFIPSFLRNGEEALKVSGTAGGRTYFSPVKGKIVTAFASGKQGITIETKDDTPVYAMDTGLVVYAGQKDNTGFTVIIKHPNGTQTVYGGVEQCRLEANDWIKGGEAIGKVSVDRTSGTGTFYFAVQKDGRFINPADVVNFE